MNKMGNTTKKQEPSETNKGKKIDILDLKNIMTVLKN